MFKTEKLSRFSLLAVMMLAVLLLAAFVLGTSADAEETNDFTDAALAEAETSTVLDTVIDTITAAVDAPALVTEDTVDDSAKLADESAALVVDEYGRSADGGAVALWNTEYSGAPYFRLCLHGYEQLDPDATVTVTAYLPGTTLPFYRATFTKEYLALKDTFNLAGGVLSGGAVLRLPAVCALVISVNGDTVEGWDLIYGTYVEEAAIWSPADFNPLTWLGEVFGSDYVYGNSTCLWATNFGGHVVHLNINGAGGGSIAPDDPDIDDPDIDDPDIDDPDIDDPDIDLPDIDLPDLPDIDWPDIDLPDCPGLPDIDWSDWPNIDWPDNWPDIDWPDCPGWPDIDWPDWPDIDWPDWPDLPDWPDIDWPDWPDCPFWPDKPDTPDEPTPDEPTPDEPTPDEPKPDEPTPDEPKPDEPTPDEPKPDEPTPDEPKPDEPKPDEPKPDEPTPDTPVQPDKPITPDETPKEPAKTGDDMPVWLLATLALLSATVFVTVNRKKEN